MGLRRKRPGATDGIMRVPAQLDKAPERSVQRCGLNPERPAYRPRRAACATGGAAARIDLAAQPAHRDRDRVGFRVLALEDGQLHAPDLFSELPGIVDLARPLHQEGQQGEFLGRQPQDLAIANDPAAQQVQLQVREMQAVAGLRRRIEHGAGHACRPPIGPPALALHFGLVLGAAARAHTRHRRPGIHGCRYRARPRRARSAPGRRASTGPGRRALPRASGTVRDSWRRAAPAPGSAPGPGTWRRQGQHQGNVADGLHGSL